MISMGPILAIAMPLKEIALVFFVAFWLVVALRLFLAPRDRYARAARIPLEEERAPVPRARRRESGQGSNANA